jgi:predicted metal-binding transcription factor (methanogenesis marker protein 9)
LFIVSDVLYREPVSGTKKDLVGKFGAGQIKGVGSLVSCCKCKHTIFCLLDNNALTIPRLQPDEHHRPITKQ